MKRFVTDIETSKKLKLPEGFESKFQWTRFRDVHNDNRWGKWKVLPSGIWHGHPAFCEKFYAPILEEMLELLPNGLELETVLEAFEEYEEERSTDIHYLWVGRYSICYTDTLGDIEAHGETVFSVDLCGNLATCGAELYLYLTKNNHIGNK